ncbi:DUF2786 domain-containing protein [Citrobacter braakii]|uniref:DUF2786 domain-containing protein n=1 Tax=Citrobacter braakii TaxID=57706 RepID=UPI000CDDF984|nr:DUF2786 domain-containing protein [Citrobacter braakii]POT29867.1 hypothetical protein C3423_22460 [Citrobacter braakii]POT34725.1 hypothetical protein C3431_22295 [Citrobacter braakii]POT39550.1 hypothetical protein C3425_22300 [Citrobacter braakii]POU81093.1 hypothetical protein C3426_22330 [Citrobacter braakii]POV07100.1 hypothetical protein C3427_22520 [Citrobacter braakii]
MTNETEKCLAKIKKLLNLARRSLNSHEAACALNQAQALMRKHKLSQNDIDLMDITSKASKGAPSHAQNIPRYMTFLGQLICYAMGVNCYYSSRRNYMNGQKKNTVIFYGPNERPEIAAYAFDVLSRQMVKARRTFIASLRKNIKPATKTARADQFCEGWAEGAYHTIETFVVTDTEKTLMTNFLMKLRKERDFSDLNPREAKKCRGDQDAADAGFNEGLKARLNHGVSGKDSALSLEYKS